MGVVFFPSLPFMRVMLFPSLVLGNVSREGSTFLVSPSLFSILLSLPLLSSLSPSPSFSLPSFLPFSYFISHKLFPSLFLLLLFSISLLFFSSFPPFCPSSTYFHLVFLSSFFFEGTSCTMYFQDVTNDTTDCN